MVEVEEGNMQEAINDLIMRSQGSGYLKIPSALRKKIEEIYGKKVKELPPPTLEYSIEDGEDSEEDEETLELLFIFDMNREFEEEKGEYV